MESFFLALTFGKWGGYNCPPSWRSSSPALRSGQPTHRLRADFLNAFGQTACGFSDLLNAFERAQQ